MKKQNSISLISLFLLGIFLVAGCNRSGSTAGNLETGTEASTRVLISTNKGDIVVALYDKTPQHRDNFIKLVRDGFYDGLLFHRVISGFMIQTGDPLSRDAVPGEPLGTGGPGYTIPAEIINGLFHHKGALAAARQGDQANPERRSSGSQFYIVQGRVWAESELAQMEQARGINFSEEQLEAYTTIGGTPHLDDAYTVFGYVAEGLDVIDRIAGVETGQRDRPVEDVSIVRMEILE